MFSFDRLTKIISTYELPEIETPEDALFGSLHFVIQVLQRPNGSYFSRLLRKDWVQVTPVYYSVGDKNLLNQITVQILVPDSSCDWDTFEFVSEHDAIQFIMNELCRLFAWTIPPSLPEE